MYNTYKITNKGCIFVKKRTISTILVALLALSACAGCGSGTSISSSSDVPSNTSLSESSVVSEVSVESSKTESSKQESSEVEKKITNIALNSYENVQMYDTDCVYDYVKVQGTGYSDYTNEIKFFSSNPKVATIESDGNRDREGVVWYKITGVSTGTTKIYAQTKDGKMKTSKRTINVISEAEESRLAEESKKAEESRLPEESRKAEESRQAEERKNTLYNENGIKIMYKGISEKYSRKMIKLFIENNSSNNITVQVRDFSINGYMINPIFSSDVATGKKINDDIDIFESDLEDNGIDEIKTIEFKIHYFNSDSWSDDIDSDVIKINVK